MQMMHAYRNADRVQWSAVGYFLQTVASFGSLKQINFNIFDGFICLPIL